MTAHHSGTLIGVKINNTPWLRSNRLLHHFIQHRSLNESNLNSLLVRMSDLASRGLINESKNLPQVKLSRWLTDYKIVDPQRFIQECNAQLSQLLLVNPGQTISWLRQLKQDDDYSDTARVLGLYPLMSIPFRYGVVQEQQQIMQLWSGDADKNWSAYQPSTKTQAYTNDKFPLDSLGLPVLTSLQQNKLLNRYAPTWMIASETAANIPGQPFWHKQQLKVNVKQSVSYNYVSLGIFNNQPVLQLNYLTWFTERPSDGWPDLLAGQHDAVIFRIHLTLNYQIIAYDSIHLCGCWYTLVLEPDQPYIPRTGWFNEPTLVLRSQFSNRMALYLQTDTHLLIAASPAERTVATKVSHYTALPFEQLLSLPLSLPKSKTTDASHSDQRKAVFNKLGYVAGSQRDERWLYWPMGIKSPGTLRRPGDHAINFIGKLHFDDPLILEKLGVGMRKL